MDLKTYQILMLIFSAFLITFNCENSTEPELDHPERPQIVPKSPDEARLETGIDAIPEGDGIFFDWYLPQDSRVKWIKIYRRLQNEEDFVFLTSLSSLDTFYIDYDIYQEVQYFYYIISVTRNKVESEPSDTLHYRLYPKPDGLSNSDSSEPIFTWHYPSIPPLGYLLKLEEKETFEIIWQSFIAQVYEAVVKIEFNWDGNAQLDSLQIGKQYRWRVDVIGNDLYSGSESNWKLLERN